MTVEHFLDLDGRDVLCIADDDVLEASRDPDVAGGIDRPEVPGVEPSFGIERSLVERRIDISGEALWTPKEKLAFLSRSTDPPLTSTARTETPGAGRPTDVVRTSAASWGVADVAFGNSVRPQLPMSGTPNVVFISRCISLGTGAPPKVPNRRSGKSDGSLFSRCCVQIRAEERDGCA